MCIQALRVAKDKTTFKHRGLFPTRPATKANIVVSMYMTRHNKKPITSSCGYCVKMLGLKSTSRKRKRANRTHLFCVGGEMFLCRACQVKFEMHKIAMKAANGVAKGIVKSLSQK